MLTVDENTGVTDVEFDPVDPDIMYAATYERRRTVWSLLAGGPGSGIHKSTDGGRSWREVTAGLPSGDMGKIGIDVSGADRDVVYATIEGGPDDRGFYRSTDRGESWERRNSYISGGTGPHYYQEIEASPHDRDLVYQMDVFIHVTRDGGATFAELGTGREKHSDNHALWIDPANGRHMLAGTDAGLYETFDEGTTWRHFPNLPVSQFYKLALDDAVPFYNILGGAQDLGTLHGPSRTMNLEGVRNRDWYAPLGSRRLRHHLRPHRARHRLHPVAAGQSAAGEPRKSRAREHPSAAGAGRPARALELGLAGHREPARRGPDLLRLAARLAERRPRQLVDRRQRRPDPRRQPLRTADGGARPQRRRALRQHGHVVVLHHRGDLRVAGGRGGSVRRDRRRADPGVRGRGGRTGAGPLLRRACPNAPS